MPPTSQAQAAAAHYAAYNQGAIHAAGGQVWALNQFSTFYCLWKTWINHYLPAHVGSLLPKARGFPNAFLNVPRSKDIVKNKWYLDVSFLYCDPWL